MPLSSTFVHTLTTASTTYVLPTTSTATATACQVVKFSYGENAPTGSNSTGDQIVTMDCCASVASSTATVALILYDQLNDRKVRVVEATVTSTALKVAADGSSGTLYTCTVAFADGTNKVDLNGAGALSVSAAVVGNVTTLGSKATDAKHLVWYVCCKVDNGSTMLPITVYLTPTRCV